jgi:adenine deaminase
MSIRPMTIDEYQTLIQVSLRQKAATTWFKNASFLNVYTGQIEQAQIYLSGKRIAYVGQLEPLLSEETEVIELEKEQILVPGYIEPHAHPFQWYNPFEWGKYLVTQGTTTSINDNMALFMQLSDEQAIQFVNELDEQGMHLWLWWSRFDGQTNTEEQKGRFSDKTLEKWLSHPLVVQGGEFTSWPYFLKGNADLTRWMLMTKQNYNKRIEGHLPGASLETLNALTAAGVSADHEALSGQDVLNRLRMGLYASLRYSSIRPDLPQIIKELFQIPDLNLSRIMLTNDGASPFFVEKSGVNKMIKIVMDVGYKPIDAYRMSTLNPATYYGLDQDIGGIAPGRLAHINVLEGLEEPTPIHVMFDGKWVVRQHKSLTTSNSEWLKSYFKSVKPSWDPDKIIELKDQGTVGIQLLNEVITKPYTYDPELPLDQDEAYLFLIDDMGEYAVTTRLKGYVTQLKGLASTYTSAKDYILIGTDKEVMRNALQRVLDQGGGIVAIFENGEQIEIPLPLSGGLSAEPMETLIELSYQFVNKMKENGHPHADPIYTLLFLTATHLPFIRITKEGIYLIKEQKVVQPVIYF